MIKPMGNRVLVKKPKEDLVTKSGFHLTNDNIPQSLKLEVMAIGPDVSLVKPGALVLAAQYAPTGVQETIDDKDMFIIPVEDILAVIVPDQPK